jgi:hypothetical protein
MLQPLTFEERDPGKPLNSHKNKYQCALTRNRTQVFNPWSVIQQDDSFLFLNIVHISGEAVLMSRIQGVWESNLSPEISYSEKGYRT